MHLLVYMMSQYGICIIYRCYAKKAAEKWKGEMAEGISDLRLPEIVEKGNP